MNLEIERLESYSRGELLLKAFFGVFYIGIPHGFGLIIFGIWGAILGQIAFWIILFTGKYPQGWFEYQVKLASWGIRVNAALAFQTEGFPAWGLDGNDEKVTFDVPYPETLSRGKLLLKIFFGFIYVIIPHGFCLAFRSYATMFLMSIAFWIILFTGKYPETWFNFNVGTIRWAQRVMLYMGNMSDDYPPFSGKVEPQ